MQAKQGHAIDHLSIKRQSGKSCSFGSLLVLLKELHLFRRDQGDGAIAAHGFWAHVISEFCGVSLEALTLCTSTGLGGTSAHDAGVDGASDAVLLLDVDLGEVEVLLVLVCKVVFHVSPGGSVKHVSHLESLNCLVFAHKTSAVYAANGLGEALVILRSTVVTSLRWHIFINNHSYRDRHFNALSNATSLIYAPH